MLVGKRQKNLTGYITNELSRYTVCVCVCVCVCVLCVCACACACVCVCVRWIRHRGGCELLLCSTTKRTPSSLRWASRCTVWTTSPPSPDPNSSVGTATGGVPSGCPVSWYTHTCTCVYTHTCARIHARTHICTHACTHARTHSHTHTGLPHTCTHTHTHTHTHTYTHTLTLTHTHNTVSIAWLGCLTGHELIRNWKASELDICFLSLPSLWLLGRSLHRATGSMATQRWPM